MKKLSLGLSVVFAMLASAGPALASNTRPTNPNALSIEVFGKSFVYTIQYDRAVTDNVMAGIGWGSVGLKDQFGNSVNNSASLVPVYVGYYFQDEGGSPYAIFGASLVTNQSEAAGRQTNIGGMTFSSAGLVPFFGAGYEVRTDSGFLFRVTGYGLVGTQLKPWFGGTFGYAF